MRKTRRSLFYLVGYLALGGAGFLLAPQLSIRLLQSNASYSSGLLRLLGALMIALSILVGYVVRERAERLYPGTLIARVVVLVALIWAWLETRNPMFVWLLAIVALGWLSTLTSFLVDRASIRRVQT